MAECRHNVPELTDPGSMSLAEWARHIHTLITLYGPTATLTLDAGYNNIDAAITYHEPLGLLHPPSDRI